MRTPRLQGHRIGRRHTLGNMMAAVGGGGAVIVVLATFLPWVIYSPGGDSAQSTVSGLHGGAWGIDTVALGVALAIAAFLAAHMVGRLRFAVVAATSVAGLAVAVSSWHRHITLDTGAVISGPAGQGLVLTAIAFGGTALAAAVLLVVDWSAVKVEEACSTEPGEQRAPVRLPEHDQPPRSRRERREGIANPWSQSARSWSSAEGAALSDTRTN